MAWNYARFVERVVKEGKAAYDIPMYVNGWLQQPNHAWPGTYPSGGPMPQVHDIWRAGAPDVDILAPDLYLPYFDEVCERFSRNGNPLFIPETGTNAANLIMAVGKFNTIGFSPFGVDGGRPIPAELAATYGMLDEHGADDSGAPGDGHHDCGADGPGRPAPAGQTGQLHPDVHLYGRNHAPGSAGQRRSGGISPPPRQPGAEPEEPLPPLEAAAIVISTGPDEYYFGGGGMRVDFTPNTPGPPNVGLGVVQTGRFVDGKWELTRWIEGDDDAQGEILVLNPGTIVRVQLYRVP